MIAFFILTLGGHGRSNELTVHCKSLMSPGGSTGVIAYVRCTLSRFLYAKEVVFWMLENCTRIANCNISYCTVNYNFHISSLVSTFYLVNTERSVTAPVLFSIFDFGRQLFVEAILCNTATCTSNKLCINEFDGVTRHDFVSGSAITNASTSSYYVDDNQKQGISLLVFVFILSVCGFVLISNVTICICMCYCKYRQANTSLLSHTYHGTINHDITKSGAIEVLALPKVGEEISQRANYDSISDDDIFEENENHYEPLGQETQVTSLTERPRKDRHLRASTAASDPELYSKVRDTSEVIYCTQMFTTEGMEGDQ